MTKNSERIVKYLNFRVDFGETKSKGSKRETTLSRMATAFDSLPEDVLDIFLKESRDLQIRLIPDPSLPFGMKTRSENLSGRLTYILTICDEAQEWPEDHFIGCFLRELGHVVAKLPPECDWPTERGERARFREFAECRADTMVWRWGLRHYDIVYLTATYPSHWVDKIVNDISLMLISDNQPL